MSRYTGSLNICSIRIGKPAAKIQYLQPAAFFRLKQHFHIRCSDMDLRK